MSKPEDDGLDGKIRELKSMSTERLGEALDAMSPEERRTTLVGIVHRFRKETVSE